MVTNRDESQPRTAICFTQNSRDEVRIIGGGVAACLAAEPGMKQSNYVVDYDYREDN